MRRSITGYPRKGPMIGVGGRATPGVMGAITAGGAGYTFTNSEAETVVNAFSVEPNDTRKELIDDLVGALKTAGVWSKMDLLYVLAADDEQSAKINWKNPGTHDLTNTNSTTFTADVGFTGNGSNMFLNTGCDYDTLTQLTQNSAHIGAWDGANSNASTHLIGTETTGYLALIPRSAANDILWQVNCGQTGPNINITDSVGHVVANRSGASALQAYKNGSSVATATDASIARQTKEIWFLRHASTYSARTIRLGHVGASLTGTEVTDTYNAFNTYLSAL